MLESKGRKVKLSFEDWGQDIQSIDVDKDGNVIEAHPCNILQLANAKVVERTYSKGMKITVKIGDEENIFPYPLLKAEGID